MTGTKEDRHLAEAAIAGDLSAAHQLLERHVNGLTGYVGRLLRNPEDRAEVVQEAMTRALAKLHTYDPARPFRPWLYRIARNRCIDRIRRQRPTGPLFEEQCEAPDLEYRRSAYGRPADEAAAQHELEEDLHSSLDMIGDIYKEIIILYHFKHLTYPQIAELLELPEGTVMNRLFRARKKLLVALEAKGYEK